MDEPAAIRRAVKAHYEKYVYPRFPLLTSVRECDTYALNLESLWARCNGARLVPADGRILLAGCGSFSPYPTAVANGSARITALDLSKTNLDRARWHTRLHLRFNVEFVEGDVLDAKAILGEERFHFIDCYGVLHHVPDVVPALQAIRSLLREGGMVRIMVYSAGARRSIQAARTAMKLLRVDEVKTIKRLYRRATGGSRFKDCIESHHEAGFDWGLADMFLHPYAKTYKIDEWLDTLGAARLEPILFAHAGALAEPAEEIERLRQLETANELATNFILLAGRTEDCAIRRTWNRRRQTEDTLIWLNPVIGRSLSPLPFKTLKPGPKLGFQNPPIDFRTNRLLARFERPARKSTVEPGVWGAIQPYLQAMFLIETAI